MHRFFIFFLFSNLRGAVGWHGGEVHTCTTHVAHLEEVQICRVQRVHVVSGGGWTAGKTSPGGAML